MRFPRLRSRNGKQDLAARMMALATDIVDFVEDYDPQDFDDSAFVSIEALESAKEDAKIEIFNNLAAGDFEGVYSEWLDVDPEDLRGDPETAEGWKALFTELRAIEMLWRKERHARKGWFVR